VEVEMKIRGLMMDPVTNMPVVILKDVGGDQVLPIWVGIYEANAIALEIEKVSTPRPMTHDLLKNLLIGLEAEVRKVVVNDLRDDTFFAVIWLEREGQTISIDSRPSDALALALRVDCPIFVEDQVLKTSRLASALSDKVSSEEMRSGSRTWAKKIWGGTRCSCSVVGHWSIVVRHHCEGDARPATIDDRLTTKWILPNNCNGYTLPDLNSRHSICFRTPWA
jgi:uncharacterized protein